MMNTQQQYGVHAHSNALSARRLALVLINPTCRVLRGAKYIAFHQDLAAIRRKLPSK